MVGVQDSVESSSWEDKFLRFVKTRSSLQIGRTFFCFWEGALPVVSCRVLPPPPTRRGDKKTKRKSRALPRRVELWKHIFTTSGLALLEGQKPLKFRERYRAGWGLWNHIFITSGLALLEGQKPLKTKKYKKKFASATTQGGGFGSTFLSLRVLPSWKDKDP